MYLLLKMGVFHCYVSLPEGSWWSSNMICQNYFRVSRDFCARAMVSWHYIWPRHKTKDLRWSLGENPQRERRKKNGRGSGVFSMETLKTSWQTLETWAMDFEVCDNRSFHFVVCHQETCAFIWNSHRLGVGFKDFLRIFVAPNVSGDVLQSNLRRTGHQLVSYTLRKQT